MSQVFAANGSLEGKLEHFCLTRELPATTSSLYDDNHTSDTSNRRLAARRPMRKNKLSLSEAVAPLQVLSPVDGIHVFRAVKKVALS